eukprot:3344788-Amphidinium_carterae.1
MSASQAQPDRSRESSHCLMQVMNTHEKENGTLSILTKGDNNQAAPSRSIRDTTQSGHSIAALTLSIDHSPTKQYCITVFIPFAIN